MADPTTLHKPGQEATQQEASREQRIEAIRKLAGNEESQQSTALVPPHKPLWQRWQLWLALVVVFGFAGAILLHLQQTHASATTQQLQLPLQIVPGHDQLDCPHDVAWSPHGDRIAILAYQYKCPGQIATDAYQNQRYTNYTGQFNSVPGLINIYDTEKGRLLGQIHPNDLLLPHFKLPQSVINAYGSVGTSPTDILGIDYTHLLWSPGGQRLAITFYVYVQTGVPSSSALPGTLPPGYGVDGVLIIDLACVDLSMGTDGRLTPETPLTNQGIPATPGPTSIGNPDGGASFTIWQPGWVLNGVAGGIQQPPFQGAYAFTTDIAAWSPDGRYLAERIDLTGLLTSAATSGLDTQPLTGGQWTVAPYIPVRDASFGQIQTVAGTSSFTLGSPHTILPGVLVSWRPDGKFVAVNANTSTHEVDLYNCATGKPAFSFKPALSGGLPPGVDGEGNTLRWSPDGSHLLLFDTATGIVTIWPVTSLY